MFYNEVIDMADIFDIANLITTVGADAVKIKQEPGLPEKSSNEILTELFSTFDADEDVEMPVGDSLANAGNRDDEKHNDDDKDEDDNDDDDDDDDDNNDADGNSSDKIRKRRKKSKKKHKHNKDRRHKKKSRRNSSTTDSELEINGNRRKKKHKKKVKRRKNSDLSNTSDSDEPKIKIKKDAMPPEKNQEVSNELKTVFDLVQSVVIKKDPNFEDNENHNVRYKHSECTKLPSIVKKTDDESDLLNVPRLLEKADQQVKGKILIKDLKNSSVYNETVKKIEDETKQKVVRTEDGELSNSEYSDSNRTPTLSPTPPWNQYDDDRSESSIAGPSHQRKRDLRLVLKQKEKLKKYVGSRSSTLRHEDEYKDNTIREHHSKRTTSSDNNRRSGGHSKDRRDSTSSTHARKRSRSRERESWRARSNDRKHRDKSRDRGFSKSKDRSSRYPNDSYDDRRYRSEDKRDKYPRCRSRSKERKERIEIDKKKLLEIARKNAITMIKSGALPLAQQDKAIAAIQAGGKSVDELIDFCKSLSKSEELGELSSVSSDEAGSETEKGFHHPFLLKEKPSSIVMNIRDSKQLPTKTFQERTTESSNQLRLQFPVSSGQQHRRTESEWIDVTSPPPIKKSDVKKTFVASSTLQPQAFTIIPPVNIPTVTQTVAPVPVAPVAISPPILDSTIAQSSNISIPQSGSTVFPQSTSENVDVGIIVSQRLAAMRKLRDNPNDTQALNEMHHAQNEMKTWAESKQMPGQFTGSTGAKVLSPAELTSGYQAWAHKDQLTSAQPVSGGMGMALLQKMGWRPGEGLGKNKEGTLEPLQLEVKLDKRGLISDQDIGAKTGKIAGKQIVRTIKTLEGKHPVSLLGEYCSKRKFGAPLYELCFECGPDHKKNFLFKVKVNGIEYKPSVASPNKKQAKAEAAQICLQTLGLLPT